MIYVIKLPRDVWGIREIPFMRIATGPKAMENTAWKRWEK